MTNKKMTNWRESRREAEDPFAITVAKKHLDANAPRL
jgi:hypothetical protein